MCHSPTHPLTHINYKSVELFFSELNNFESKYEKLAFNLHIVFDLLITLLF